MKYLLDTSVFREIGKLAPHEHVRAWLTSVDDGDLALSALTVRKVAKGIAKLATSKPRVAKQIRTRTDAVFEAFVGAPRDVRTPVFCRRTGLAGVDRAG